MYTQDKPNKPINIYQNTYADQIALDEIAREQQVMFSAWEDEFFLEWRRVHLHIEGMGPKEIIPLLHRWYESGKTPQEAFALFLQEVKS